METTTAASTEALVIGWASIAQECGKNARDMRQANADGRLAVKPLKIGHQVAYTPAMLATLKASLKN